VKKMHKTLLIAALMAVPFAAANAHDDSARHRAWIEAQKIDIKPTLTIKETTVPADQVGNSTSTPATGTPSGAMPSSNMPSSNMPSSNMPSGQMPSGQMPSGQMPSGGGYGGSSSSQPGMK